MEAIEDDMFESGLKAEPLVRLSKLPALENYPGDIALKIVKSLGDTATGG